MSISLLKEKVNNIKKHVTIIQVLDHFGVERMSKAVISQVRCPFHGNDKHASARIYETDSMHCWVCDKAWDVISFVQDKLSLDFSGALKYLEDTFKIPRLDLEELVSKSHNQTFVKYEKEKPKDLKDEFEKLSDYLIKNKEHYDFEQYVKYFCYFDKLYASYRSNDDVTSELKGLGKEVRL